MISSKLLFVTKTMNYRHFFGGKNTLQNRFSQGIKRVMKSGLLVVASLVMANLSSCQSLDDIYDRLDKVEADVVDLKSAVKALQDAYNQGKIIKSVTPLTDTKAGGWRVTFSDDTSIRLENGIDGIDGATPTVEIINGYWWINGKETGVKAEGVDGLNGTNGVDGKDGVTPTVDIIDGYWWINGKNTGVKAVGQDGKDGQDGINGTNGTNGTNGADGKDGITPFLKIDQDGYWTVSYDNGQTFNRLLDNEGNPVKAVGQDGKDGVNGTNGTNGADGKDGNGGEDGAEGLCIRLVINDAGYYVIQSYYQSDPATVVNEIVTPYTADASRVIASMTQDDKTHVITMTLADGSTFTFNMHYVTPTSIAILSVNPIYLSMGTQASVEFRVNPSNALFNLSGDDCQIELDKVGTIQTRSSYVTTPSNYKLVRIEQVYDGNTEEMKVGQYRAIIEDTKKSAKYDEMAALVLNVEDSNGDKVQISSSAFEVKGQAIENLVHYGLPIVVINTPNSEPIVSKEDYITGSTVSLLNADMTFDFQGEMKIKGRGNSTWSAPKKPYKMKFDKKLSLFGDPKDKEWVLLANYHDKSMIRTDIAYWMASNFGQFDYVPRFHFVDLMLNGKYNGTYQLGDQVKIAENRVNVGDDGFLLEIDAKADATDITFRVPHIGKPINIKDPDVVEGDENYNYVKDYVTRADATLYASNWLDEENGYKSLIDMQSFAEWYVMMELTKNNDAVFFTSCYMNLSRMGKLKMGPLWDFDVSLGGYWSGAGRDFVNDPEGYYIKTQTGSWIARLFSDPAFVAAVKEAYAPYYNNKTAIIAHVESVAAANKKSAIANNKLWGTLCDKNSTDDVIGAAYDAQIEYLKNWISTRIEWLKTAFDEL